MRYVSPDTNSLPSSVQFRVRRTQAIGRSGRVSATLALWLGRWRERRRMAYDLHSFSPEVLEDLGLTRDQAHRLAHTPFWRPWLG